MLFLIIVNKKKNKNNCFFEEFKKKKLKKMGNLLRVPVICSHDHLKISNVKGSPEMDEDMTSYKMQFAHLSCGDCGMNCYRKRSFFIIPLAKVDFGNKTCKMDKFRVNGKYGFQNLI